jgi:hypothetical protein
MIEKLPFGSVATPIVVPFTAIEAPCTGVLSLEETTLPVIVRFCASRNVALRSKGIHSRRFSCGISKRFVK